MTRSWKHSWKYVVNEELWTRNCAEQRQVDTSRELSKICRTSHYKGWFQTRPLESQTSQWNTKFYRCGRSETPFGIVNYLSIFLPCLSGKCEPLGKLTVKDSLWSWHEINSRLSSREKKLVTSEPILSHYDRNKELNLQCDSFEKGLGAALLQLGKPLAH